MIKPRITRDHVPELAVLGPRWKCSGGYIHGQPVTGVGSTPAEAYECWRWWFERCMQFKAGVWVWFASRLHGRRCSHPNSGVDETSAAHWMSAALEKQR